MAAIRILPEALSNKIAAGEVVERPASVVKELLENSLDAHARRIRIAVEQGGRSLIQVADDGDGMTPDDALLCLERYATSKIHRDADLFAIRTLGFRGEALPSIAAVSRFNLVSRTREAEVASEIQVDGGTIRKVTAVGAPAGTMITVRSLFYNTPARRKFLKTVNTELSHIGDVVAAMGLAWPQVGFQLLHNQRRIKNWPAGQDPFDRVVAVLGREVRHHLHALAREADLIKVSGWVAHPRFTRSTSRGVFVFVNGRMVRDRTVLHGLLSGYRGRLMKGQYPLAAVFLDLPPQQVDVNVHPTKHEVRFGRARQVHQALVETVKEALASAERPIWHGVRFPAAGEGRALQVGEQNSAYGALPDAPGPPPAAEPHSPAAAAAEASGAAHLSAGMPSLPPPTRARRPQAPSGSALRPAARPADAAPPSGQREFWSEGSLEGLRIIGQFAQTYILCETQGDLLLVDQHAAHERIYFEQLQNLPRSGSAGVQQLLLPETVELSFREAEIVEGLLEDLKTHGLDVGNFGGNTFAIRSVPAFLSAGAAGKLLKEIAEKAALSDTSPELGSALDRSLYVMACHGAIRANQHLAAEQMRALLIQLAACRNPAHCPHGRPTWIQISRRELDKRFRRVS